MTCRKHSQFVGSLMKKNIDVHQRNQVAKENVHTYVNRQTNKHETEQNKTKQIRTKRIKPFKP